MLFQSMFHNCLMFVGFWVPLKNLMNLQHFSPEFCDLGVKVAFHHEVGKVAWSWANLGDLLALGGDPVVEPGDMFSLLVRELHQLQFIN